MRLSENVVRNAGNSIFFFFFFLERQLPRVTGSDLILHVIDLLLLKGLNLT